MKIKSLYKYINLNLFRNTLRYHLFYTLGIINLKELFLVAVMLADLKVIERC